MTRVREAPIKRKNEKGFSSFIASSYGTEISIAPSPGPSRPSLPRDAGQKVRGCAPRPSPQQTQVFHALQRRRVKRAGAGERRVFFSVTKKESRLTAGLRRQALPLLVLRHLVAHHVQPAFALHDLARVAQALDRGADLRRWRCGAGSRGRVRGAIEEEGWRRDCGRDPASAGLARRTERRGAT